jgi:hypothetical protein
MKLQFAGPLALVVVALLSLPSAALAEHRADVSPEEFAKAINQADPQAVPYRKKEIAPEDIQVVQCAAPDEDPTEFVCTWRQRVDTRWIRRRTWLVIDANGWHVFAEPNY